MLIKFARRVDVGSASVDIRQSPKTDVLVCLFAPLGLGYIDYANARAIDTVSHAKLFHRLTAYGITGTLLDWIKSFISERTQQTRIGNSVSCSVQLC